MATSIGALRATLTVDSTGWTAGLDKARRDMQRSAREIDRSLKQDFGKGFGIDALRRNILSGHDPSRNASSGLRDAMQGLGLSLRRMDEFDMMAQRDKYQRNPLGLGQGMGGLQIVAASRGARDLANGVGDAAARMQKLVVLGAAAATAIRGAVVLSKAWSNELDGVREGWANTTDRISESMKIIPIFGDVVSDFVDRASGRDLRRQAFEQERDRRNRDAAARGRAGLFARDVVFEAGDAAERARIAPLRGANRELEEIELSRRQAMRSARLQFESDPANMGSGRAAQALTRQQDAIQAEFDAKRAVAIRNINEQRAVTLASIDAESAALEQVMRYDDHRANLIRIEAQYRERINRALMEGETIEAERLANQGRLALQVAEFQRNEEQRQGLRNVGSEIAITGLRLSGRQREAALLQVSLDYEDKIRDARRKGFNEMADQLEVAKQLRIIELERSGGFGGPVQASRSLSAVGERVIGSQLGASAAATLKAGGDAIRIAGWDEQTELLRTMVKILANGTPARAS